jgi:hypothetical protein
VAADLATLAVSLVGVLGVGTAAAQWVGGSKDRRAARAEALRTLAEVENARWAATPEADHPTFRRAARDFQTAALIARLPRPVVNTYVVLATASHGLSVEDAEVYPDEEVVGSIDGHLDELVRDVARLLTDAAWSSGRLRWFRRAHRRHRRLVSQIDKLSSESQNRIRRARSWTT